MAEKIRWGILGLGSIAQKFAEGLTTVPDAELLTCASRSAERTGAFAERWYAPRRYTGYEALVADPDVDAVYIATPHSLHAEMAILALEHGKAVLCEKPFTVNATEADRVITIARRQGCLLMEAMWSRFLPHVVKALELVRDGAIGEVRMLQADFGFRGAWEPESRLLNPVLAGGGLLDVGVYVISLAHLFLGIPEHVSGIAHIGTTGVDEQAGITLGYPAGRIAVLSCGVRTNTPQEAVILGTEGRIRLHAPWWGPSSRLTLTKDGMDEEVISPEVIGNGYNYEAVEFGNCLRQGILESPSWSLNDTLTVQRTMDTLRAQWGLKYPMENGTSVS